MGKKAKWFAGIITALALSVTIALAGMTTAFAASVQESTVQRDFDVQWGDWVQYRNDSLPGDENLSALAVTGLAPSDWSGVGDKAFIISNKLNTSESFTLSFETAIPSADNSGVGSVGFFARAAVDAGSGSKVIDNMGGFLVEIFRDNMRIVYHTPGIAVAPGSAFSETVTAGQIVKVEITVTGNNVTATLKNGATVLSTATATSGVEHAAALKAGFSVEKTKALESGEYEGAYAVFKNVVYKVAGQEDYKAYPFKARVVDVPTEIEPTEALNPNFAITTGNYMGTADGNYVKAVNRHVLYDSAVMVSTFGGVYGANFNVSLKLRTPTAQEVTDSNGDASSGFFFRQAVSWDLYSGIYVRVESSKLLIANNLNSPPDETINVEEPNILQAPFKTGIDPESTLKLTVSVSDNNITVTLKDLNDESVLENESITTKARMAYKDNLVAGLASDHMDAVFSEIVMTSGSKSFKAYPVDPEKESVAADIEVTGEGLRKVMLTKGNEDVREDDEDIIDSEFAYILYAEYDGTAKDLVARASGGGELPAGLTANFEFRLPPTWEFFPWEPQTDACRHGCAMTLSDADGYIYARQNFAFKIYAKEVTLTGVTAVDKQYDGSTEVTLTGGTLTGVIEADADKVGFSLGLGIADQASVGQNINVNLPSVALTGEKAANYELVPPTGITVNITKGKAEAPDTIFIEDKTDTTITVEAIYGAEYSIDGTTWQDSNEFTGLKAGTEYTVSVRIKANENQDASDVVTITVKTNAASGGGSSKPSGGGCKSSIESGTFFGLAIVLLLVAGVMVLVRKRKANN